jgi:hypothetical protein
MASETDKLLTDIKSELAAIRKQVDRLFPKVEQHMKPTDLSFLEKVFDKGAQATTVALLGEILTELKNDKKRKAG